MAAALGAAELIERFGLERAARRPVFQLSAGEQQKVAITSALAISHGVVGSEGRGGRRFAVVNRDGTLQLPPEVVARYAAGTLFKVTVDDDVVQLRPEAEADDPNGQAER